MKERTESEINLDHNLKVSKDGLVSAKEQKLRNKKEFATVENGD